MNGEFSMQPFDAWMWDPTSNPSYSSFQRNRRQAADPNSNRDSVANQRRLQSEAAQRLLDQANQQKAWQDTMFLNSQVGPQNLLGAPRNANEARLQDLVQKDYNAKFMGFQNAPKWEAYERDRQRDILDWQDKGRTSRFNQAMRPRQLRGADLDIATKRMGLEKTAQEMDIKDLDFERDQDVQQERFDYQEYQEALDLVEQGVPAEKALSRFPQLSNARKLQVMDYAQSPMLKVQLQRDMSGMTAAGEARNKEAKFDYDMARKLADEYNMTEQRLAQLKSKAGRNMAAIEENDGLSTLGNMGQFAGLIPIGPFSTGAEYFAGKRAKRAIKDYPGQDIPKDYISQTFKADPMAGKFIRRGAAGWEPIIQEPVQVQPEPMQPAASGFGGAMRGAPRERIRVPGVVDIRDASEALNYAPGQRVRLNGQTATIRR